MNRVRQINEMIKTFIEADERKRINKAICEAHNYKTHEFQIPNMVRVLTSCCDSKIDLTTGIVWRNLKHELDDWKKEMKEVRRRIDFLIQQFTDENRKLFESTFFDHRIYEGHVHDDHKTILAYSTAIGDESSLMIPSKKLLKDLEEFEQIVKEKREFKSYHTDMMGLVVTNPTQLTINDIPIEDLPRFEIPSPEVDPGPYNVTKLNSLGISIPNSWAAFKKTNLAKTNDIKANEEADNFSKASTNITNQIDLLNKKGEVIETSIKINEEKESTNGLRIDNYLIQYVPETSNWVGNATYQQGKNLIEINVIATEPMDVIKKISEKLIEKIKL